MAKNKDTMKTSLSGYLDVENLTVTHISEKEGEKVFDLHDRLKRYDGLEVTITVSVDKEITPIEE